MNSNAGSINVVPNISKLVRTMVMGVAPVVAMAAAQATTVTLNAIETGAYSPGLVATPDYVTGISFAFGSETRGYLVFDLSVVQHLAGNIVAGTLLIANGYSVNQVGPNDPLPLRIYGLPEAHAGNFGIHGGAGTGGNFGYIGSNPATLFASVNVLPSDTGTVLSIPVNGEPSGRLARQPVLRLWHEDRQGGCRGTEASAICLQWFGITWQPGTTGIGDRQRRA